jgi:hypothetical protein
VKPYTILALRVVMATIVGGALIVQAALCVGLVRGSGLEGASSTLAAYLVLAAVCVQVSTVSVWRLVGMVRSSTVFSNAAFRHVDVVLGAVVVAAVLTFALAAALAVQGRPSGVVMLVGAVGLVTVGMSLLVLVLRALLEQAVARDVEASGLQAELDEVI